MRFSKCIQHLMLLVVIVNLFFMMAGCGGETLDSTKTMAPADDPALNPTNITGANATTDLSNDPAIAK